jgi:hypothetical protein
MSNSLAIAAVTATLQSILQHGVIAESDLTDTTVTILPLDKARIGITKNQLNLFLYQVARNVAWANAEMPRQVSPGETGYPPLPLNLYYLLTAFGQNDDASKPFGHALLGKAMSLLHDHPILSPDDIKAAVLSALPESDLDRQIERIRITLHPVSFDDQSKLWTGFATQYRLSVAYEVAVALIESTRPARTPLPVLARGQGDSGVSAQADLTSPLPMLETLVPPGNQPSARLNDVVTLTGFHLDGTSVSVQFRHALWNMPLEVAPDPGGSDKQIAVTIPNASDDWPAGFYAVTVLVQRAGEDFLRSTNQLVMALAPTITISPASPAAGNVTFTVTTTPSAWPDQRCSLLLGDQEVLANPHAAKSGTLAFAAGNLVAGSYYVRLRVDGVDSLLVKRAPPPPVFDDTQKVTVT